MMDEKETVRIAKEIEAAWCSVVIEILEHHPEGTTVEEVMPDVDEFRHLVEKRLGYPIPPELDDMLFDYIAKVRVPDIH
jgi:hypothetical protein